MVKCDSQKNLSKTSGGVGKEKSVGDKSRRGQDETDE